MNRSAFALTRDQQAMLKDWAREELINAMANAFTRVREGGMLSRDKANLLAEMDRQMRRVERLFEIPEGSIIRD